MPDIKSVREHVRFDPMAHAAVEIPGTGMTAGQIMGLFLSAIDHFKAGLPAVTTVPEPTP